MTICWRSVRRLALWNIGGAFLGVIAFARFGPGATWRSFAETFFLGLMFSGTICSLCYAVLPRLGPYLHRRFPPAVYWVVMIAAMFILATTGSAIALLVMSTLGYFEMRKLLFELGASMKISVITTLAIGVAVTMVETMRGRLERATLALRTKERDEAEARRLAAEANLSAIESRVQPHFLFNTLNSIAALIPQDPGGAERMTSQLASLLRSSLDAAGTPLTSVEQELKHVRDYLEIERVRFGPRLRYDMAIEAGLETMQVPRFAVQTVVENSVKYAVAPSLSGATIGIAVTASGDTLTVAVHDNGPGFDAADAIAGHGLALVRDRLAMTFGERGRLIIRSQPGNTIVAIEIDRAGSAS